MKSTNTAAFGVAAVAAFLALGGGNNTATTQVTLAPHAHNTVVALSANHPEAHPDRNFTCTEENSTCDDRLSSFSPTVTAPPAKTALPGNAMVGLPGHVNTGA